ncbi:MAG: OB-fold nucleic acid binding domain-containing protein, partial [Bacillota bacterium]
MTKPLPSSVQFVKGVGPSRAELLGKLGIETVEDLLYFFPRDYEDRRELTKIKYIQPEQVVTIQGRVVNKHLNQTRSGRSILKVSFTDDTDVVNGVWFNQPYLKKKFEEGDWYFLSGEVNKKSWYHYQKKEIVNPVYEKIEQGESIHTGRVVPIYPLTKGLPQ